MEETKRENVNVQKKSNVRWIIPIMLFIAIMFNYADREIWTITAPAYAFAFGWTKSISSYGVAGAGISEYSLILFGWSLAYALFNFPGGSIVDKLGLRKSMATFYAIWSVFTVLTAATFNFISMLIVRLFMGAGEGPVWPVNAKSAKTWTNRYDESKAYTWAGAGQAVGPVVAATIGVAIYALFGWPAPFIFFGALGIVFALIWYFYVRDTPAEHKGVNQAELDYINEGKNQEQVNEKKVGPKDAWRKTLRMVFTTQAGIGTLLIFLSFGYILYTFLYWLPTLLFSTFVHSVTTSGIYTAAVDTALIAGFLGSGPLNDGLLKKFSKVNARRIGSLLPMSIMIVMIGLSYFTGTAHLLVPTVLLLAAGAGMMNLTVGSWAVNAIDLSPSGTAGTVYGFYNGMLNLVGAFNSIIEGVLFIKYGAVVGFTSSIIFMAVFIGGYVGLIRKKTWKKAMDLRDKLSAE
ncbi:MFS transporter permease [Acidiplasma aeolicum]|uniref:MFS transporter permease n=2 Tax=Acidiplasma TaxID=507753 RepID=A0A0Q0VM86_9ARCH|nr:MFS transporter permease [Acidiplasma sp. MBA-1]KPV45860.1 MFS transporter permease [Acidiplasma aeolicum]KQB34565.1 MFS transporter permease [Acidiplasma cupricumulans]KQB35422.1 MFS transporter permease [Acidiplasma aeolicum]